MEHIPQESAWEWHGTAILEYFCKNVPDYYAVLNKLVLDGVLRGADGSSLSCFHNKRKFSLFIGRDIYDFFRQNVTNHYMILNKLVDHKILRPRDQSNQTCFNNTIYYTFFI
uniref:DEP domain-containing protein n=1 Tax=Heterorhabditis bacteriophora TaxID=37862 RepID=A0A1I7WS42_HETBA